MSDEDFDTLCEVVEVLLGIPGGVIDQMHLLAPGGREALDRFGRMRRQQTAPAARDDQEGSR